MNKTMQINTSKQAATIASTLRSRATGGLAATTLLLGAIAMVTPACGDTDERDSSNRDNTSEGQRSAKLEELTGMQVCSAASASAAATPTAAEASSSFTVVAAPSGDRSLEGLVLTVSNFGSDPLFGDAWVLCQDHRQVNEDGTVEESTGLVMLHADLGGMGPDSYGQVHLKISDLGVTFENNVEADPNEEPRLLEVDEELVDCDISYRFTTDPANYPICISGVDGVHSFKTVSELPVVFEQNVTINVDEQQPFDEPLIVNVFDIPLYNFMTVDGYVVSPLHDLQLKAPNVTNPESASMYDLYFYDSQDDAHTQARITLTDPGLLRHQNISIPLAVGYYDNRDGSSELLGEVDVTFVIKNSDKKTALAPLIIEGQ